MVTHLIVFDESYRQDYTRLNLSLVALIYSLTPVLLVRGFIYGTFCASSSDPILSHHLVVAQSHSQNQVRQGQNMQILREQIPSVSL